MEASIYETVEQWELRNGKNYHDSQGVFFNGGILPDWGIFTYLKAKEMCITIEKFNPMMIVLTAENIKNKPVGLHLSKGDLYV